MKIDPALLAKCRTMALTVAPELQQQSLYVLDAAALDASVVRAAGSCRGFALPNQLSQVSIRDSVADWRGWGPAIVLNGQAIAAEANAGQFERCVLNTMVHELAHIVPVAPPFDATFAPEGKHIEAQRVKLAADLAAPTSEPGAAGDADGHDVRFYRRAVHLLVRAAAAGFDACHDGLLPACSRTEHYLPLLLREALVMQDADFQAIDKAPLPPGLVEQHDADREHFRNFQKLLKGDFTSCT